MHSVSGVSQGGQFGRPAAAAAQPLMVHRTTVGSTCHDQARGIGGYRLQSLDRQRQAKSQMQLPQGVIMYRTILLSSLTRLAWMFARCSYRRSLIANATRQAMLWRDMPKFYRDSQSQ